MYPNWDPIFERLEATKQFGLLSDYLVSWSGRSGRLSPKVTVWGRDGTPEDVVGHYMARLPSVRFSSPPIRLAGHTALPDRPALTGAVPPPGRRRASCCSPAPRCMITASRRASATMAFFMPRCLAIFIAHALSQDHFFETTSMLL